MSWNASDRDPEWPFDRTATDFTLDGPSCALLIVDMHAGDMQIAADAPLAESYPQIARYWNQRMDQTVLPNTRRLIDLFRDRGWRIVYTRNGAVTSTGDELSGRLRRRWARRGDEERTVHPHRDPNRRIHPSLEPRDEDLIVDKLTSGAFTGSILDHALRNMDVRGLVITGVLSDMCVLGTARSAAEIGYDALICEDTCTTYTQRAHDEAMLMHARVFGRVGTTEQVIGELQAATA